MSVTVPMDDAALFAAATSDEPPAETVTTEKSAEQPAETPQETAEQTEGQPRDEHGRFAAKAPEQQPQTTEAQPATEAKPQPQADAIPPWRLREEAEARRAAEGRVGALERQLAEVQGRLRQFTEKPADPIDPFADPQRFRDEGVRQAVDPVMQQLAGTREYFSRRLAIATHGQDTVNEAYRWLEQGARSGDPRLAPVLQRVSNSIDPFDDLVTAYKQDKAITTVGSDPEKWFQEQLAARAKDPAQRQQLMAHFGEQPQQNGAPQQSIVKMPPSLTSVRGAPQATGTLNDADLYAFATQ